MKPYLLHFIGLVFLSLIRGHLRLIGMKEIRDYLMNYAKLTQTIRLQPIQQPSQPLMRNNVLEVIILLVKVY